MNRQILKNVIFVGLFLVPFIPLLTSSVFFFPFIVTKAFVWRIIVEIIFGAWILLALLDPEYRPKKSIISWSVLGFLVIIGLADLFGASPLRSFWSNFERMDGYVALLHLGMFFMIISSVFKEIDWKRWWNVSLLASFLIIIYCFLQIIGLKTINQGGVRVDGTFGNAIYLAVYMLFHIFIAMLFLLREWKNVALRWVYTLLIVTQLVVLYFTATRGAILGLIGGLLVVAVLNLRNKESELIKRIGISIILGVVLLAGGIFLLRDAKFVQSSPVLSRFTQPEGIETQGRYYVWPIAWKGVKDRPIFGWGQENFGYVFQEYYTPDMFRLEPWFDRAHNIFLDWAVSGGLLGLLSYLSLYVALLVSIWQSNRNFTYTEKTILTGLISAYFFHNVFVFDHLISYILFFSLLAYVHQRKAVAKEGRELVNKSRAIAIGLPVTAIFLVGMIYFVNAKPLMTNIFLIESLKLLQTPGEISKAAGNLEKAYTTSPYLGRYEAMERVVVSAVPILTSDISMEDKNSFFNFDREVTTKEGETLGQDARYRLTAGSFFASVGLFDDALVYLNKARELMPGKQQILFEIGSVYINQGDKQKGLETFKEAYEAAPDYLEAKVIYLIGAIYAGDRQVENQLLNLPVDIVLIFDDRILNAYYANKRLPEVVKILEKRIELDPARADKYRELIKQAKG